MKKLLTAILVLTVMMIPATGCGQGSDSSSADSQVQSSSTEELSAEPDEKTPPVRTLGTKAEEAYSVLLTNETGQDVTSMKIGTSESMDSADDLLEGEEAFADEEQVQVFYAPEDVEEQESEGEKELTPEYEVEIALADGSEHTLHAFPFDDISEGAIKIQEEEGIAYLSYTSVSSDEEVETLDAEKAIIDQEKEAAAKAAAAKKSNSSGSSSSSSSGKSSDSQASSDSSSSNGSGSSSSGTGNGSSSYSGSTSGSGSSSGSAAKKPTSSSSGSSSGSSGSSGSGSSSGSGASDDGCVGDGLTY